MLSQSGCQQGDPIGPLLFSLGIKEISEGINSEHNTWFLDDGGLGDRDPKVILQDIAYVRSEGEKIGLKLNSSKCEVYMKGFDSVEENNIMKEINNILPNIKRLNPDSFTLLGSAVTEEAVEVLVKEKLEECSRLCERVKKLSSHSAFFILKNCFALPKLIYTLRTTPSWLSGLLLSNFDDMIQSTCESILNLEFSDLSWIQASFPVNMGGLGLRSATDVCLSAFLSSALFCRSSDGSIEELPFEEECRDLWSRFVPDRDIFSDDKIPTQKVLDRLFMSRKRDNLLNNERLTDDDRLRIISTCDEDSGQFLNAIPSRNLGLRLEDQELMIAVALRMGCKVTSTHRCLNCPDMIQENGVHGLSCQKGVRARAARHRGLNIKLARILQSIDTGTRLEPESLWAGKRPDGVTVLPWERGLRLIWDVTVVDSFALTYRQKALTEAGLVAEVAEKKKLEDYFGLEKKFIVQPVAFESLGAFGPSTKKFLKSIGKELIRRTGDLRASTFMRQSFSIELQRYNSWCVKEALVKIGEEPEEMEYLDIMEGDED
jgi:hypothetical protein